MSHEPPRLDLRGPAALQCPTFGTPPIPAGGPAGGPSRIGLKSRTKPTSTAGRRFATHRERSRERGIA